MKHFFKSVAYALNGWRLFFATEKNGQRQALIVVVVLFLGFGLRINSSEWIAVFLCIGVVIGMEMINSVLEQLVDFLHPSQHPKIKWIKDVAAGAVLWAAITSSIIGCLIFLPKIISFFNHG